MKLKRAAIAVRTAEGRRRRDWRRLQRLVMQRLQCIPMKKWDSELVIPPPSFLRGETQSPLACWSRIPLAKRQLRHIREGPVSTPRTPCRFLPPRSISSCLQPRLLQDAIEGADRQIISTPTRHCNQANLRRMLELPVTSFHSNLAPSVILEKLENLSYLQRHILGLIAA